MTCWNDAMAACGSDRARAALLRLDPASGHVEAYGNDPGDVGSLGANVVKAISTRTAG